MKISPKAANVLNLRVILKLEPTARFWNTPEN